MAYRYPVSMGYFESDILSVDKPELKPKDRASFWEKDLPILNEQGKVVRGGMFEHQRSWWELPTFVKVLVTGYGGGKCCRGNTEYYDPKSGSRRIVSDVGNTATVSLLEGNKLAFRKAEAFASGVKPCLRVRLANGSRIDLSLDHPVFTPDGWKEASKLVEGDLVAVPRLLPAANTVKSSDEEIRFVAYLMADGGLANGGCNFYKADEEILDSFEATALAVGTSTTRYPKQGGCHKVSVRGSQPILRRWGLFKTKSKHKRLPAEWYGMSILQAVVFLKAFLACDAFFGIRNLELTLASRGLIDDCRHLLLLLGIQCRTKFKPVMLNGKRFFAWRLVVSGQDYRNLLEVLGEVPGRAKQISIATSYFKGIGKHNTNTDIVPLGKPDLSWIGRKFGLWSEEIRAFCGGNSKARFSRTKLQDTIKHFGINDKYLNALAFGDIAWSPVASVRSVGEHSVFDLSVNDPSHNFVAAGMVIHNTVTGAKRIIASALENAPAAVAAVSPTFPLARKTTIPTIEVLLAGKKSIYGKQFWWKYNKALHYFTIKFKGRTGTIYILSGDDPNSLRGPNLASAWLDEPFIMDKAVFLQMMARVRHPDAVTTELLLSGTPEGIASWGYDLCVGSMKDDMEEFGDLKVGVIHASTRENLALSTDYVKRLERAFTDKMAQSYVEGKFVSLTEGLVYYGFTVTDADARRVNVRSFDGPDGILKIPDNAELGCGMDFNVNPMSACVFWRLGDHIHFFREIELPNADTEYLCSLLREDFVEEGRQTRQILQTIYPDATGSARKTSAPGGKTDFHYIREAGFEIKAHVENPKRKDRYNAVNGKFRPKDGFTTLTVDPRCKHLIGYLQTYSHENMHKQQALSHLTDSFSYPIEYLFPVSKSRSGIYKLTGA